MVTSDIIEDFGYGSQSATTDQFPLNIGEVLDKLSELSEIQENWDSYAARSPSKKALLGSAQIAFQILQENTPTPEVFPVPNGNIQFEWSCLGLDIEIEVESPRKCYVSFEDLDSKINWDKEFTFDLTELSNIISDLTERFQEDSRIRTVS